MPYQPYKIAGYHKLYYDPSGTLPTLAQYVGTTGDEGIVLTRETLIQPITSDELGPEAIIDGVYQGANVTLEFVLQDINQDHVQALLHPFQESSDSAVQSRVGVAGQLGSGKAGMLYAEPIDGSPAYAAFGAGDATANQSRKFMGINVAPVVETLDATARFVPVRFQCYPFEVDSVLHFWEWVSALSV